jgi:hypothetical protein
MKQFGSVGREARFASAPQHDRNKTVELVSYRALPLPQWEKIVKLICSKAGTYLKATCWVGLGS